MAMQRDGDRVAVSLKRSHLRVAAILGGIVAGLVLFLGVRALDLIPNLNQPDEVGADAATWIAAQRFEITADQRPARGPTDAPVRIVEFTDYGCPYCRRHAMEVLPALFARFGDTLRYVVRHFPIPALTANAMSAAEAAECAHRQGRFWEYKAALVNQHDVLSDDLLLTQAEAVGLDREAFGRCLTEGTTRSAVERDILDGWELGVTGTPTFFINGRRFTGRMPLQRMVGYVELALETDG
jgi:protein-disulfide isomerase